MNHICFVLQSERIHAFIVPQIADKFEKDLREGVVYTVRNFKVKIYKGDETNRPIRNDKHIYFSIDTELKIDESSGLFIPHYGFDLFMLEDLEAIKSDNRFLTGSAFQFIIISIKYTNKFICFPIRCCGCYSRYPWENKLH